VGVRIEQVHVPATAAAEAGLPAEDLGGQPIQVDAVGDRQVVRAVGGGDRVPGGEVREDAGRLSAWYSRRIASSKTRINTIVR